MAVTRSQPIRKFFATVALTRRLAEMKKSINAPSRKSWRRRTGSDRRGAVASTIPTRVAYASSCRLQPGHVWACTAVVPRCTTTRTSVTCEPISSKIVLRRVLEFNGYAVNHVVNITDVGHLVSDADSGEDKMEKGARRTGKSCLGDRRAVHRSLSRDDIRRLNILEPHIWCRATEHIDGADRGDRVHRIATALRTRPRTASISIPRACRGLRGPGAARSRGAQGRCAGRRGGKT